MKGKTKTQITDEILLRVEELAAKGFNNVLISQSLNIGLSTLSRNKQLKQALQKGKLTLSEKVTQSVMDTLEDDASMRQLLVKRLCLFTPLVDIKRPVNAKDALDNIGKATKAYANGAINENQLRTLEAANNSFINACDTVELEARITAIEEALNGKDT